LAQSAGEIIERLGSEGLARVLDDLMDKPRLARLATACDLKYPGVRIRSVKRDRLLTDLVARAQTEKGTRDAIQRTLDKETRAERRRWNGLSGEEKARRLSDEEFLRSRGNLGRHLWFLASSTEEGEDGFGNLARQHLQRMVQNGTPVAREPVASAAEQRLKRRIAALEKKTRHLEAQLARGRDSEKRMKRDLIQRKGELAETRMLAERVRRERDDAKQALDRQRASRPAAAESAQLIVPLERAVKRLSTGQRKLIHAIDKMKAPPAPARPAAESVETLIEGLKSLQKEIAALRREQKRERDELVKRLDAVASIVKNPPVRKERKARVKEADKRVGVFIDVQNVYYGARKLKGKLDFDALMDSAVVGRRLIHSTAYVVESKEIDQSGFIARLEQRAIEVRRKPLRVRADGSTKGDWDMELALDILDSAANLDVVVLVSGDGDFTSLVKRVKRIGPRVEVIAFPRNTAKSLLEASDRFQPLDRKFMIYNRPKRDSSAPQEAAKGASKSKS
jgi:uncharacterized LabA/DUF88 family protein